MIKSVRAAAAAALAAPLLAVAFAAPANAEPEDVTLSVDARGNFVEVSIANNSPEMITCNWVATNDADPDITNASPHWSINPNRNWVITTVFIDGDYHLSWSCVGQSTDETWGTGETDEPLAFTADSTSGSLGSLGSTASGSVGSLMYGGIASLEYGSLGSLEYGSFGIS
ncbi:hypothetical protein [Rhodococcus spongiicola]|uniref:Ig-like domain-containing protein n=1 Tax=Rhodococcus spongiicola TaxID=2487352 RepID=A0A3S3ANH4_9NOCA|nr:hypothetical protein [Rhodococcus spongiicola]RVW04782.1 hypothetical protein EF834_07180 [Rhodococcus spongiicola]